MPDNRNSRAGNSLLPRRAADASFIGAQSHEGIGLRDVMRILKRRFWTVALVTGAISGAAAWFVHDSYPRYRATATLRLADLRQSMTEGISDADPAEPNGRTINPQLSQIQLLTSRALLGGVVDSLSLRLRPDFHGFAIRTLTGVDVAPGAPTDTLQLSFDTNGVVARGNRRRASARYGSPLLLDGVTFTVTAQPKVKQSTWLVISRESAIDLVLQNLRVSPRPQTDVVDVSYSAYRPRIAQAVANSVVDGYRAQDLDASREQAHRRRVFLEGQLAETDASLADAQLALSAFRRRAQLFSARDKLTAQQADLMSLDTQRSALVSQRGMLGALMTQLEGSKNADISGALAALMASPELAADPGISTLYRQLASLRVQRDSLTTGSWSSPPSDPVVRRIDDLIASTSSHVEDAIRGHLAGTDARIAALDQLRASTAAVIEGLPTLESEEVRLLQRVASVQTLADDLRSEFQKARLAEAIEIGRVSVVDHAPLPYAVAGLPRGLQVVLGVFFGLLAGSALAIVLEVMNTSIRREQEVTEALNIPSLGVIPRASDGEVTDGRARFGGIFGSRLRPALSPGAGAPATLPSIGGEAYRILRTNLLFSSDTQGLRTLVVTSALPQEGKTVIAANLAISFAREGMRVLLIDADLRRPAMHRLFGIARSPGLAQALANGAAPAMVTNETSIAGLSLLPCGSLPSNPTDLVRGTRMRELLETIGRSYDLVIIDTPPVLPVADAAIIAAVSDGVLMVVRAGKTSRGLTQEACARLAAVGANIVGTVLNDPSGRNVSSYSYGSDDAELAAGTAAHA